MEGMHAVSALLTILAACSGADLHEPDGSVDPASGIYAAGFRAIGLDLGKAKLLQIDSLPFAGSTGTSPIQAQEVLLHNIEEEGFTPEIAEQLVSELARLDQDQGYDWFAGNRKRNFVHRLDAILRLFCFVVLEPVRVKVSAVAKVGDYSMFECRVPFYLREPGDSQGLRLVVLKRDKIGEGYTLLTPKRFMPVISACGAPGGLVILFLELGQLVTFARLEHN